jgi:hypothetical protein
MACIIPRRVDAFPNPLAHVRASWLMTLSALAGSLDRLDLRHRLAACRLHRICPWRMTRLAGDRSWISGLPVLVARVLGTMVSTTFARSSVAPAVLRRAVVGQRILSL